MISAMTPEHPTQPQRRSFLKILGGLSAAVASFPAFASAQAPAPARRAGAKYMGDFAAQIGRVHV